MGFKKPDDNIVYCFLRLSNTVGLAILGSDYPCSTQHERSDAAQLNILQPMQYEQCSFDAP